MQYIYYPKKLMNHKAIQDEIFTLPDQSTFVIPQTKRGSDGKTPEADISLYEKEYPADVVMLKNHVKDKSGHGMRGFCSDVYETKKVQEMLRRNYSERSYGFALDLKNAAVYGADIYELIISYQGIFDVLIWPLGNKYIQYREVIRAISDSGFDGTIILDAEEYWINTPISLRSSITELQKKYSDYIDWQLQMSSLPEKYEAVVLFGAGAMCENYMNKYSEKNMPLFTCDNNSAIWGKTVHGLEVKNPRALLELPADTAIFICNSYYNEIKKQLIDMGIKNPIEFYSDECNAGFEEVSLC